ncbi:MAG: thiamine pyrophosphate-dependent enzyme, partial [Pseudomonadota bacterium]
LATSFAAKGLLDANHPQHLGAFGLPTEDHVDRAIASADLILAVGYDPVEYPVSALTDGTTPVVALSEASLPLDVGWPLAASVEGDLVASLSTMVRGLEARRWTIWDTAKDARRSLHADLAQARAAADQTPPTAQSLATAVSDGILPDDTTICGVGTHKLAMARNFMPKRPGQIVIANGLAGMGLAVPGAIAAARLQPAGRSIAICGDGEVMMNVQEFETATRLNLALMVVVWIDGAFGLIEDKQEAETGTRPDLSFATMDWAALARAFGWIHRPCDTAADLRDALHAFDGGRHLVTVPVSYAGDLA